MNRLAELVSLYKEGIGQEFAFKMRDNWPDIERVLIAAVNSAYYVDIALSQEEAEENLMEALEPLFKDAVL